MTGPTREPRRPPAGWSAAAYPRARSALPETEIDAGAYVVRFARTPHDLDRILRLRYEVFNLELGEGLDLSHVTGRDEDELDARVHHLMILSRGGDEVVGTYRMQTGEMARQQGGFYSEQEFDLAGVSPAVLDRAVEIGRACVAKPHRNGRVLHLLWRGLAAYLTWNRKQHLFGCCSVNSQDPALGLALHRHFLDVGAVHPRISVTPRPGLECRGSLPAPGLAPPHVPALFRSYLDLGAKVCGSPAIDRSFKTIDWLVALDVSEVAPATYRTFFR